MANNNKSTCGIEEILINLFFILDIIFGIFVVSTLVNLRGSIQQEETVTEIIEETFKYIKKSASISEDDEDFYFEDADNGQNVLNFTINFGQNLSRQRIAMMNWLRGLIFTSSFALGLSFVSLFILCKNKVSWFYLWTSALGSIFPLFLITLFCAGVLFPGSCVCRLTGMAGAWRFYFLLSNIYKNFHFYLIIAFRFVILDFVGSYVYEEKRNEVLKEQMRNKLIRGQGRGRIRVRMICKKPVGTGNGNTGIGIKKKTTATANPTETV